MQQKSKEVSKFHYIFYLFAVGWAILYGVSLYQVAEAYFWEKTEAVITHGEVTESITKHHSHGLDSAPSITWSPDIRYAFSIGHLKFEGSIIHRIGVGYNDEADAQRFLEEHPVGKKVTVYYNPDNPKQSTLYLGVEDWFGTLTMAILPIIVLVGMGLAFKLLISKYFGNE